MNANQEKGKWEASIGVWLAIVTTSCLAGLLMLTGVALLGLGLGGGHSGETPRQWPLFVFLVLLAFGLGWAAKRVAENLYRNAREQRE
jgi:membrane protease YdiL (CAAX protease family)